MNLPCGNNGALVAFEGIDGSGKSSLAALLYQRLRDAGVETALVATRGAVLGPLVLPAQPPSYAQESLSRLACLVWPADGGEQHHELGYGYWLGLAGAYFRGLEQALLPDLRRRFDIVIVENWCYKVAAKLALKGYDAQVLQQSLPLDACLDAVFLVDTPPEAAWQRKQRFSFVELGGQDGYADLGRESFVGYQSRIRGHLLEFADERWTRIENGGDVESACARIEDALRRRLAAIDA